uniref:Uncharacterized protein n=1 Tax=Anopheles culicifacies TaxID=139723 RepID=A0A182MV93_9DIPT
MAIRVTKKCCLLSTLGVLVLAAALTVTLVLVLRDDEEISETYRFTASSIELRLEEQPDHRYILSIYRGITDKSVTTQPGQMKGIGTVDPIPPMDAFRYVHISARSKIGAAISSATEPLHLLSSIGHTVNDGDEIIVVP